MRVLLVPEVYRRRDATACGTLNDAVAWVDRWLARDDRLHVYWLLPPRSDADYDASYVHADGDRVTLLEAEQQLPGSDAGGLFSEGGYSTAELRALHEGIFDPGAYVDVVVDQRRTGRFTLYKWLLERTDQWAADVRPFDVVANVHDLQVPFKYRWCSYRNEFQARMEACASAFADGIWFTAGVDAEEFRSYAGEFLRESVVEDALQESVVTGSPIDFDAFSGEFADEPRVFHVAGSLWDKKNADRLLAVADRLHREFDVRTVLTSMEPLPETYRDRPWVTAHPEASRATYERALDRGDLAVCASAYETMARTPFEQAASGQVLVLRDRPWIYDTVPEGYRLAADLADLEARTVEAVENWDEAVAATRDLLAHAREARGPDRVGDRTYHDLRDRVDAKLRRFDDARTVAVVERALADVDEPAPIDEVVRATAAHTDDGRPLTRDADVAFTDVVYALRSLGYADRGDLDTPVFEAKA